MVPRVSVLTLQIAISLSFLFLFYFILKPSFISTIVNFASIRLSVTVAVVEEKFSDSETICLCPIVPHYSIHPIDWPNSSNALRDIIDDTNGSLMQGINFLKLSVSLRSTIV